MHLPYIETAVGLNMLLQARAAPVGKEDPYAPVHHAMAEQRGRCSMHMQCQLKVTAVQTLGEGIKPLTPSAIAACNYEWKYARKRLLIACSTDH